MQLQVYHSRHNPIFHIYIDIHFLKSEPNFTHSRFELRKLISCVLFNRINTVSQTILDSAYQKNYQTQAMNLSKPQFAIFGSLLGHHENTSNSRITQRTLRFVNNKKPVD